MNTYFQEVKAERGQPTLLVWPRSADLDPFGGPEEPFVGGEGRGMAYLKHEVELCGRILAFLDQT